jgi:Asp-tRNA(Asn)/Glu-tRNA(Gln) amidotransferase A subunit family amidase
MALNHLDAVTYPRYIPRELGAPTEPDMNGRSELAWTVLTSIGFPAISVPAGFTTAVYDRVVEPAGGTSLVGPIAAQLPVGIDFLAGPFSEPTLIRIAGAYEAASRHRTPPAEFGPLPGEP